MLLNKKLAIAVGALAIVSASAVGTFFALDAAGAIDLQEKTNLTFSLIDEKKVYDGKALVPSRYNLSGNLIEGHEAIVTFTGSQIEAGESQSSAKIKIQDSNNHDVTNRYYIQVEPAKLKVEKKSLAVRYKDAELEYSGESLNFSDYEIISGSLVDGQHIQPVVSGGQAHLGVIDNREIKTLVVDSAGNDVTKNYELETQSLGKVEVVARPISFDLKTHSKVYDGKEFEADWYITEGTLVKNHYAVVTLKDKIVDAVENRKTKLDVKIFDEDDNEVTNNYLIKNTDVVVNVEKRNANIVLPYLRKEYDGQVFDNEMINKQIVCQGVVAQDEIFCAFNEDLTLVDACIQTLDKNNITITGDDAKNYNITLTNGLVEIYRKKLFITLPDLYKVYDKQPFDDAVVLKQINAGIVGLVGEDKAKITGLPKNVDRCRTVYKVDFKTVEAGKENNYEVIMYPGRIQIDSVKITITVTNKDYNYDGTAKDIEKDKNDLFSVSGNVDKNLITFDWNIPEGTEFIDAGTYDLGILPSSIKIDGTSISNENANYDCTLVNGKITIKPMKAYVDTTLEPEKGSQQTKRNPATWTVNYTNAPCDINLLLTPSEIAVNILKKPKEYKESGLLTGHTVQSFVLYGHVAKPTLDGTPLDIKDVVIWDKDGRDVSHNYELYYDDASKVNVSFMEKDVKINIKYSTYYKDPNMMPNLIDLINKTVIANVNNTYSVEIKNPEILEFLLTANVGSHIIEDLQIDLIDGEETLEVILVGISLEVIITQKDIVLNLPTFEKEYDGTSLSNEVTDYIDSLTEYNLTLNCAQIDEFNTLIYNFTTSDFSCDDNYRIIGVSGGLKITPKDLVITLPNVKLTYNGILTSQDVITKVNEATSLINASISDTGLILTYQDSNYINCGNYLLTKNDFTLEGESLSNYKVQLVNGQVQIERKQLTISLPTIKLEYSDALAETISLNITDEIRRIQDTVLKETTLQINDRNNLSISKAGYYTFDQSNIEIVGNDDNNYELIYINGSIEVTKANLYFTLPTIKLTYNENITQNINDSLSSETEKLATKLSDNNITISLINPNISQPGYYVLSKDNFAIGGLGLQNYNLILYSGAVDVSKGQLVVNIPNLKYEYAVDINEVITQELDAKANQISNDLATYNLNFSFTNLPSFTTSDYYYLTSNNCSVTGGGLDLYNIVFNNGGVEITKKIIYVSLPNLQFTFSESLNEEIAVSLNGEIDKINSEILGDTDVQLVLKTSFMIDKAGTISLSAADFATPVSDNYQIIILGGSMNVQKGTIEIQLPSFEKAHDGKTLYNQVDSYLLDTYSGNLSMKGIFYNLLDINFQADKGTYTLSRADLEFSGDGLNNYNIVVYSGTLTIK